MREQKPAQPARRRIFLLLGVSLAVAAVFSAGAAAGFFYFGRTRLKKAPSATAAKDVYLEFIAEIYDKIKDNFWDKMTDERLTALFGQAAQDLLGGGSRTLARKDKEGLKDWLAQATAGMGKERKKKFVVTLAQTVLANLKPFGRNGLYTAQDEENLKNRVRNVNPEKDLYKDLGIAADASASAVKEAYQRKAAELSLKKDHSPAAKERLKEINYAYGVLSSPEKKERYDQFGVEPTVFSKLIDPEIFYLYIKRFSPTTLEEFKKAADGVDDVGDPDTLVFDLRGNIGGSIDVLPYFLGPFIGSGQYAYEFFHQGEYTPTKTKTGWWPSLVRYKKVIVLINGQTQSTAELMAATLKKYNVGITLGVKTKGWGTVEKVFKLNQQIDKRETYSIFLVHSLTLRADNQPIEGRGVEPTISMESPDWAERLFAYFHYRKLNEVVGKIWRAAPADVVSGAGF